MQPHPYQGYTATVVDGGWLPARVECKLRRAHRVCAELTLVKGRLRGVL